MIRLSLIAIVVVLVNITAITLAHVYWKKK